MDIQKDLWYACLRMRMDVQKLRNACYQGDDDAVKNILEIGLVDINAADDEGVTALMCAVYGNHPSTVKTLLSSPGIRLDTADENGFTALHMACYYDDSSSLIPLLAEHRGCTSAVLNKRVMYGETPLMQAVATYNLECVKELGKLEGTNFHAKYNGGETLLDVARRGFNKKDKDEVIKYLLEKQKKETLEEKAAYHVATHLSHVEDVEELGLPRTQIGEKLISLVSKFLDY